MADNTAVNVVTEGTRVILVENDNKYIFVQIKATTHAGSSLPQRLTYL